MLRNRALVVTFALALGAVFAVASASAATLTVNDLTDTAPQNDSVSLTTQVK